MKGWLNKKNKSNIW